MSTCRDERIYVIEVEEMRLAGHITRLVFHTTRGDFEARMHSSNDPDRAVLMLDGIRGGMRGPESIYPKLAECLLHHGIASLRMDYRLPGDCVQCGIDTLLALQYLDDDTVHDVVLVGWSFGGAVALAAGSLAVNVKGVAAISTVEVSDCCARRLQSKPLLLIHGDIDMVSPVEWPRRICSKAEGPSNLLLYANTDHDMHGANHRLINDLTEWVLCTLH